MPEYTDLVADHFRSPRNAGRLACTGGHRVAEAGSQAGGLWIRLELAVVDGCVVEVAWQAYGCPHLVALASLLSERIEGLPVEAVLGYPREEMGAELDLPPAKLDRLLLVQDALATALGPEPEAGQT